MVKQAYFKLYLIKLISGNMDGIKYFNFNDEFQQETVRVQNDNPCAPDYIDSAWLDDNYAQAIQEEIEETDNKNEESWPYYCQSLLGHKNCLQCDYRKCF